MRHAKRLCILGLSISHALGLAVAAQPRGDSDLQKEWEVHLGGTEQALYRTAVCPQGTAHVINSNGRLISVDSTGRVFRDSLEPRLLGFRFAICDADGTVYAVVVRRPDTILLRLRSSAAKLDLTSLGTIGIPINALAPASVHGLLAVSPGDDGYLTWLSPEAKASPRFGLLNRLGDVGGFNLGPLSLTGATVIWDERNNRALVFPAHPYEMHVYSAAGEFVARRVRQGLEFRTPRREALPGGQVVKTGDRVQAAVLLPNGRIATQFSRMRPESSGIRYEGFLDVVDDDLREVVRPIRISGAPVSGFLQGASASGDLYFQKIQSPVPGSIGVNLVRARITRLD